MTTKRFRFEVERPTSLFPLRVKVFDRKGLLTLLCDPVIYG